MIVDLNDPRALGATLTGGKGSRLAALAAQGFPVPPGFVVTTEAFAAFVDTPALRLELPALLDPEVEPESRAGVQLAEGFQALIRATPLPAFLLEALRERLQNEKQAELWAVRSSAVAEDLAGASFAGQYDSVLGVSGFAEVAAALVRCWASFFNAHALRYRRDRGIGEMRGAVVVQRLIPADAAGVCFTLDPVSGDRSRVLINANFGLGESVVGGNVTPDTFVVDRTSRRVVERRLATKTLQVVPAPGGSVEAEVDERRRDSASLSDQQAAEVAALAIRVEEHEAGPVDIEWALSNGELFLLQSRPITAAGRSSPDVEESPVEGWVPELNTPMDPRYPLYSNGNISEVLPGCITPLSWSYIGPTIEHAFRSQVTALGAVEDDGREYQVLGFFFHRPYVCVSFLEAAAARTPGVSPDTVREEFVGPPERPTPALTLRDLLPDRWPALVRVVMTLVRKTMSLEREARECETVVRRQHAESTPETLRSWPDERLLDAVRFSKAMARLSDVHVWASSFATISFRMLRGLTASWLGDTDGSLAARLVTGIGGLPSADPAFGLYDLTQRVVSAPPLRALFESVSDDGKLLAALDLDENLADFRHALSEFLCSFGHRAVCEAEFRNPCWREDPAQVLGLVRNYLHSGITPPGQVRERQTQVQRDAARVIDGLSLAKRWLVRRVVERTRRGMGLREQLKDLIVLRSDRARRAYAELRDRMVARKRLSAADDIYFLLGREVDALVTGALTPAAAAEVIARRRREFAWCEALQVPKLQEGGARTVTAVGADPTRQLRGMGVSPGRVEGRARVILDPRQGARIEPGEILVAPVTDAGWTPLFISAAGLVVEVGGLLSHGSVVAREYGLPAVVGVAGATTRIHTGDLIALDGSTGVVSHRKELAE